MSPVRWLPAHQAAARIPSLGAALCAVWTLSVSAARTTSVTHKHSHLESVVYLNWLATQWYKWSR